MNDLYTVWPDGVNYRPLLWTEDDAASKQFFNGKQFIEQPRLDLRLKDFQTDLDEESEINPGDAKEIVTKRFANGFGDCVFTWPSVGPSLILSENAYHALYPVSMTDGQFFPFQVGEFIFYLFHCFKILNCIDVESSAISFHATGSPSRITKFAFNSNLKRAEIFFRIAWPMEETRLLPDLFATPRLEEIIGSRGLRGFRLKKIPV